jgi:hypothetical protein
MSENTEAENRPRQSEADRVGDILRKERLTRRIAIETIAKDLKLNVKYIKALEANEYNSLPAEPYIRVYFRSIAKYLMLDPEEILKKFYDERGIPSEAYKKDTSSKIAITMLEKERASMPWFIIVIVIAVLAGFSFIAKKSGSSSSSSTDQAAGTISTTENVARVDSASVTAQQNTVAPVKTPATTITTAAIPPVKKATSGDTTPMILEIRAIKDSVWIQVFSDGVSSKIYLYANQSKKFTAHDSLNVHVGINGQLKYTLNGKPLYVKGKDIAIFKISKHDSYPEMWNLAKWSTVFKGRI